MKGLCSPGCLLAMIVKELIQMRRDRMTFAIMFGLPIVQILLFGFVINSDPRHLPTEALLASSGQWTGGTNPPAGIEEQHLFRLCQAGRHRAGRPKPLNARGGSVRHQISRRISVTICLGAINPPFCWKQMLRIRWRLQVQQGL
jgi:hypothetical protein